MPSTRAIELRISAFERFEACMAQDSGARTCCKVRGALVAGPEDRKGDAVNYRCRTCGARHMRIFSDLHQAFGQGMNSG